MNKFLPFQGHHCGRVLVLYDLNFSTEEPFLPLHSLPPQELPVEDPLVVSMYSSEQLSDETLENPVPACSEDNPV
jgi:hypothetical protein